MVWRARSVHPEYRLLRPFITRVGLPEAVRIFLRPNGKGSFEVVARGLPCSVFNLFINVIISFIPIISLKTACQKINLLQRSHSSPVARTNAARAMVRRGSVFLSGACVVEVFVAALEFVKLFRNACSAKLNAQSNFSSFCFSLHFFDFSLLTPSRVFHPFLEQAALD